MEILVKLYRTKKELRIISEALFVPEAGIEPARPKWAQDFKSGASTYSATQALILSLQKTPILSGFERKTRLELATPTLARSCSTN